ncbi:MAG: pyridoxal phosphate-dependent aminotransferase [bacterium]|nr:pyridoxal phosphate-dependent aminotransferase [bacterium]
MPRHPNLDPNTDLLGGSVFSALAPLIAQLEGEIFPLHIGDTWLDPDPTFDCPVLGNANNGPVTHHRYADPHGDLKLLDALVSKVRDHNGISIEGPGEVLMTAGATGALTAAAMATLSQGDEVLILAPYWPLIRGIVINSHGIPVEVPILHTEVDHETMSRELEQRITPRTAALYVNTPCNPTGKVLGKDVLAAIAEVARKHDLWIFSDEVYENYSYLEEHISIASIAPERTLSIFSFSKAYGMAGHRCGYLVGPRQAIRNAHRIVTYVWYSVPTVGQMLALRALKHGQTWLDRARSAYQESGQRAAEHLGVSAPEGGTFLFLDVEHLLDHRGLLGFLEDCLDDNLILAPGGSFGNDYQTWVRLCFTCSPPDVVNRGVEVLARRLRP